MAYAVQRAGGYSAYYRDHNGKRKSAGVFPTKKEALAAGVRAESGVAPEGLINEMSLEEHARRWLNRTNPDVLPNTLRGYERVFRKHIIPFMGDRRVSRITRRDVEELIAHARSEGMSEHKVGEIKAALGACLRVLVPEVLTYNPTHGIKIRRPPTKNFDLLQPDEIDRIIENLPTEGAQLFAKFLAITGCRHGEAAEIRVRDVNFRTREVSVTRRVIDLIRANNDGVRFQVIPGTKAGVNRGRTIGLSDKHLNWLKEWIRKNELQPDDLVFPDRLVNPDHKTVRSYSKPRPGETFTRDGKTFRHGTAYGYSGGGCRCEDCWEALRTYRASRRKGRTPFQEVEHLPNNTWGKLWRAAVKKADLGWWPRPYDLRHAYATYLVAGGTSIEEVRILMGHQGVQTTMRYLHRVESQKSKARDIIGDLIS